MCFLGRRAGLGVLLFISVISVRALSAEVLTFDDIGLLDHKPVPNGYGGLKWQDMYYINGGTYYIRPSGYSNGTVSGNYVALNWFERPAEVFAATPFDFKGAYLTAAWNDGLSIVVTGFLAGSPIYSKTVVVDTLAPTFFDFNFNDVDKVRFEASGGVNHSYGGSGTYFAMDNFTYNTVPEPSTAALGLVVSAAVATLATARRRWRREFK